MTDITLSWNGASRTVPINMPLRVVVEEIMTLQDLSRALHTNNVPLTKVAMAYGAALRFAGMNDVTDEDVYVGIFPKGPGNVEQDVRTVETINTLLTIMIPERMRPAASSPVPGSQGHPTSAKPSNPPKPKPRRKKRQ